VNFFYFPPRIRRILEERGVLAVGMEHLGRGGTSSSSSWSSNNNDDDDESDDDDDFIQIPDDIAQDLANVSVRLKLRLHEAGEMIIPYQARYLFVWSVYYQSFMCCCFVFWHSF